MPSFAAILGLASAHKVLIYVILFPLALFGGPVVALAVGFLVRLGYLDIIPAFAIMVAGDFIPDSFYYYVGKFAYKKGWMEKVARKFTAKSAFITGDGSVLENLWNNHGKKMMLFSKQAYGLSTVLLVSAGMANMSYKRFISYAFPITLAQYIVFIGLGFALGNSYAEAGPYITYIRWVLAAVAVIFLAAYVFIQKRMKKSFLKMEKTEEEKETEHTENK